VTSIVVHYSEIGTKGQNRVFFEKKLVQNIQKACRFSDVPVRRLFGRIFIGPSENLDYANTSEKLREIPGIAWFSEADRLATEMEALRQAVADLELPEGDYRFRVEARRSKKDFPIESMDINREIGAQIQERTGWQVDLTNPDYTLYIDVTHQGIFLYQAKERGIGGLPVGVSGKLICMLSGGIDSPVAAFKMFSRGCRIVYTHFHNYSRDAKQVREKVVRLVEILNRYQHRSRLYLVPFADFQQALVTVVPADCRMVAYRRVMFHIAGRILEREKALGFVTGDSVGQVASQTLENLQTIYEASGHPVFAPLIGEDKQSIMDLSKKIGTYETSIQPYDDCCTFLVDPHPKTKMRLEEAQLYEDRIPLDEYCKKVQESAEIIEIE